MSATNRLRHLPHGTPAPTTSSVPKPASEYGNRSRLRSPWRRWRATTRRSRTFSGRPVHHRADGTRRREVMRHLPRHHRRIRRSTPPVSRTCWRRSRRRSLIAPGLTAERRESCLRDLSDVPTRLSQQELADHTQRSGPQRGWRQGERGASDRLDGLQGSLVGAAPRETKLIA
jgi:hypothetical protein